MFLFKICRLHEKIFAKTMKINVEVYNCSQKYYDTEDLLQEEGRISGLTQPLFYSLEDVDASSCLRSWCDKASLFPTPTLYPLCGFFVLFIIFLTFLVSFLLPHSWSFGLFKLLLPKLLLTSIFWILFLLLFLFNLIFYPSFISCFAVFW